MRLLRNFIIVILLVVVGFVFANNAGYLSVLGGFDGNEPYDHKLLTGEFKIDAGDCVTNSNSVWTCKVQGGLYEHKSEPSASGGVATQPEHRFRPQVNKIEFALPSKQQGTGKIQPYFALTNVSQVHGDYTVKWGADVVSGTFKIQFPDNCGIARSGSSAFRGEFKIDQSILDPTLHRVLDGGVEVCSYHVQVGEVYSISMFALGDSIGSAYVENVGFNPPFSCTLGEGNSFAVDTFRGETDISLFSTRYNALRFCADQHPIIVDSSVNEGMGGVQVDTANEILGTLGDGGLVHLNENQVLLFFYITDRATPYACNPEEVFDSERAICQNINDLIASCSANANVFDPITGRCEDTGDTGGVTLLVTPDEEITQGEEVQETEEGVIEVKIMTPEDVRDNKLSIWARFWNWIKGLFR